MQRRTNRRATTRPSIVMPTLSDYYRDLLIWEGEQPRQLVDRWPAALPAVIEAEFVQAVADSGLKGYACPIRTGSTNQSIGNQVEEYAILHLSPRMRLFAIGPCSGAGYPDKVLIQQATGLRMPLEVKATSDWNPSDSNRRVLTSSSQKLRQQFARPIHHLLMTLLYTIEGQTARMDAVRLDFLEPDTAVNVRLEASVNHKILAAGPHRSKVI